MNSKSFPTSIDPPARVLRKVTLAVVSGLIFLGSFASFSRGAESSEEIRDKLRANGPPHWEKLESRLRNSQVIAEHISKYFGATPQGDKSVANNPTVKSRRLTYFNATDLGSRMLDITAIPDNGRRSVLVSNPDYAFELAKNGPTQGLYIADFADKGDGSGYRNIEGRVDLFLQYLSAAEYVSTIKLATLLDTEKVAYEVESRGAKQFIRLRFDRKFEDGQEAFPCTALIDPGQHWAVVEYEQTYPWGAIALTVDYNSNVKDIAFPQKIVELTKDKDGRIVSSDEYTLGVPTPLSATPDNFTLNAFGLTPPDHKSTAVRIAFAVVMLVVIAAIVVAMFKRRLATRLSDDQT